MKFIQVLALGFLSTMTTLTIACSDMSPGPAAPSSVE